MSNDHKSVFGIFKTRPAVERAVEDLKTDGFSNQDISVLMSDGSSSRDFAHTKGTKAPEGAAAGAGTGAVVGGTLGLLVGLGTLAIPGVGPLIAAGPLMSVLAGIGMGGAVGGIAGTLVGIGIPEYEAKRYEGHVKNGGILLSVHADSSEAVKRAELCLKSCGAEDISSTSESKTDWKSSTIIPRERSDSSLFDSRS